MWTPGGISAVPVACLRPSLTRLIRNGGEGKTEITRAREEAGAARYEDREAGKYDWMLTQRNTWMTCLCTADTEVARDPDTAAMAFTSQSKRHQNVPAERN